MRSPFTGILFAVELTHDMNMFLPLMIASILAHAFTVLTLKRSILTEKIARRGYHLSREYAVDPLELILVEEVMNRNGWTHDYQPGAVLAYPDEPLRVVVYRMAESGLTRLPVVARDAPDTLLGVVALRDLLRARTRHLEEERDRARVLRIPLSFRSAESDCNEAE